MLHRKRNLLLIISVVCFILIQFSSALSKETTSSTTAQKKPSIFAPAKSKFRIPLPPAMPSDVFLATLTAAQITAQFNVPKLVYPKENLQIPYQLTGIGQAAVEATAFENPVYLSKWVYTTSAFPKDMEIIFNYLGVVATNKSGDYPKKTSLKLSNRFTTNNYYLIRFEIRNFGKTMLKSQGYGQVTYLLKIVNPTSPDIDLYTLPRISPKTMVELYPGDKQAVSYLIKPLPLGTYLLKMVAMLNSNTPVAETDLPITVIKENIPDPGMVISETIPVSSPPMFPPNMKEWQESLHTFRIHELVESALGGLSFSGILNLPMADKDGTVVLRLITPSGLATTSVTVTLEKHKRKKR
jgi:hypothetical protein